MRKIYLLILLFSLLANNKIFAQCAVSISTLSNNGFATNQLDCINTSITLTADTSGTSGNATFSWNNGLSNNKSITVSTAGTYTIQITDNSCTVSSSLIITIDTLRPNVSIAAFPTSVCNGQSAMLVALGADTYEWDDGSFDQVHMVMPVVTTTYIVYGTANSNGCFGTDTVLISYIGNSSFSLHNFNQPQSLCLGDAADQLSVSASPSASMTYQWYSNTQNSTLNATQISNQTDSTFTPFPATIGTFYYFCIGTDDCDSYISGVSGPVNVTAIATIISHPDSNPRTYCLNDLPNQLSIIAVGIDPTHEYKWYKTDLINPPSLIPFNNSPYFTPDASIAGTLYYYCEITCNCGTIRSNNSGAITFIPTAAITNQPSANTQKICSGSTISQLFVESGIEGLSYQWFSNTINSNQGSPTLLIAATDSTYTPDNQTADSLFYFCVVSGTCGPDVISDVSGAIVVREAINITLQPAATTQQVCTSNLPLLSTDTLFVNATGSYIHYQWYSADNPGGNNANAVTDATSFFYIPASTIAGTFYYYCIVGDADGTCSEVRSDVSGGVTFNQATQINTQPSPGTQGICLGDPATALSISAMGTGSLQYQWYSNTISSYTNATLLTDSTSDAIIPNTQTTGTLFYFCVVSGVCGSDSSNLSGPVIVTEPFNITDQPGVNAQSVCPGSPATALFITGIGSNPVFQWYSNTVPNNTSGSIISGETSSSIIPNTQTAGTLYYYCVVSSTTGCSVPLTSDVSGAVIVNPLPTAGITGPTAVCENATASVTFTGSNGTAPYTFFFHIDVGPAIAVTTTGTGNVVSYPVSTASIGTQDYILDSVRDVNGCHQQQNGIISVNVISTPALTSTRALSICDSLELNYTATSSSGIITWARTAVPGIVNAAASGSNPIIETLDNTTSQPVLVKYMLTITAGSCTGYDSLLVTVNPTPVIDPINDTSFCNGTPVNGFVFNSASPNTTYKWYCSQTIGFGSSGNGSISSFFATNISNLPITDTVTVLIDTSNNHCFGDSIRFVITVNPSPPKPDFDWLNFVGGGICTGAEHINFNVIFPAEPIDTVSYLWTTIPLNNPNLSIHDVNSPNTTISFFNPGIDTIRVFSINPQSIGGCKDSITHVVGVSNGIPGEIEVRKIFMKQPGNLLIYPDNSIQSYQWGYDVLTQITPDTAYSPPINVDGQVYQFFIPDQSFINTNNELDTANYAFWVLLREGECFTRVYYNGPNATGRMQTAPQENNNVQLNLFPNPNRGIFDIILQGDIYGSMDAKIYNAMGQVVFTNNFNKTTAAINKKFNAGHLPGGLYYLVIRSSDLKKVVTRFIIQQ